MNSHLNSAKAKAEAKVHIEKAEKKALKKAAAQAKPPEVSNAKQMRALLAQNPKEARLFGLVVAKWRASSAIMPGTVGCWAAYTYRVWLPFVGYKSEATLKRHLDRLEEWGLIHRDHGAFGGAPQISFIRPSPHGLRLSSPKDRDWKHLGTTEAETLYPTSKKPKDVPPPPVMKVKPVDDDTPITDVNVILAINSGKGHGTAAKAQNHHDDDPPITDVNVVLAILNGPSKGPENTP